MSTPCKPRLLIVDDEPDMLDFLERVLRRHYAVTRSRGAEDAIGRLTDENYDVLVTDQKMPRVTGIELLERIRDSHPGLVKVMITGFTEVADISAAALRCGIHAYVLKPIDSQRLLSAIEQAYRVRDGAPFEPPE
jgi:DNA-binding NtrC family response regulator